MVFFPSFFPVGRLWQRFRTTLTLHVGRIQRRGSTFLSFPHPDLWATTKSTTALTLRTSPSCSMSFKKMIRWMPNLILCSSCQMASWDLCHWGSCTQKTTRKRLISTKQVRNTRQSWKPSWATRGEVWIALFWGPQPLSQYTNIYPTTGPRRIAMLRIFWVRVRHATYAVSPSQVEQQEERFEFRYSGGLNHYLSILTFTLPQVHGA